MLKLKFGAVIIAGVSFAGLALADGTPAGERPPYHPGPYPQAQPAPAQPAGERPPYHAVLVKGHWSMVVSAPSD